MKSIKSYMFNYLAANPKSSKGRLHNEDHQETKRTPFERDRDRIIHCSSFRKLKHKTQVFIESESDYYRTRLTHSLEVSQISRSLCRAMNLNEDLGEVVSLAHDLGHPPFGHNGERALNNAMANFGGFDHNDQTLRVLTHMEKKYPNFRGLNLTWESLEGIVKHNGVIKEKKHSHIYKYNSKHNLNLDKNPHLESQIASISDDIAYNNHDVEDALRANLINLESLNEINYYREIIDKIKKDYGNIDSSIITYQMLRISISNMINDIIKTTNITLEKNNIVKINDVFNHKFFLINMSDEMKLNCNQIKEFLFNNVYNHDKLIKKRIEVEKIIEKLFNYFLVNFNSLPKDWLIEEKNESKHRIICDYISGMTDRYASKLYKSIYE